MPSSISSAPPEYLQTLLASARPFLRGELEAVDQKLPAQVAVLRSVGAGECWHKHSSFLEHLMGAHRILKIWKAPEYVCLCGLFHSSYSNSYVNLAIFDPNTGRDVVRGHVGETAERLIHLFCVIPRQQVIHDDLQFKYSDSELIEHLKQSEISVKNAKEKGLFNIEEIWRKKLNTLIPANGITVKHIRTREDVVVSRRILATFLMVTIADFSDQRFGYQDELFGNHDGRCDYSGGSYTALWPGDGKPGLWVNFASRMGAIYTLLVREEEIYVEERKRTGGIEVDKGRDEGIDLVVPPVFDGCTKVVDAKDQIEARDLYWEAMCLKINPKGGEGKTEELLLGSIEKNPFVGEPYLVLCQLYLSQGRFEEAEKLAEKGLILLLEWGSPWDKKMSWGVWVAWARLMLMKAKEKAWPNTTWGIINLGLVR